ncbi:MAG: MATE family efflux transporter [Paludibacteraceae bacterium]
MTDTKSIFRITYPIFFSLVAQNIINVTDTAFLGHVSEVALGASAIGGVFYMAVYFVGFGFSQGVQILIGRRNGEKNYPEIGTIFNNSLAFNFFLATLIFILSAAFMPRLLQLLVNSSNIYAASVDYLQYRIFGFFFSFLNVIFRAFFVGITRTKVLTISGLITALVNVALDYVLIFGKFGFPEWGIKGAAVASVVAEMVTSVYLVCVTRKHDKSNSFGLFRFNKFDWKTVRKVLDLSIFIMFQFFISTSIWFVFFIFIERMGERPLAVTNIARSLYVLLMIPGSALATTVSTLVSNMIGAGEKDKVISLMYKTLKITIIIILPLMIMTFIYPEMIAKIYTNNPDLILASIPTLRVVSIAMVLCGVCNILFNTILGTGNTRIAFVFEIVTLFFYMIYVYYTAIILQSSVETVWMSEFVYWILMGAMSYIYLLKGNWREKEI